jgi:hypothetical protein
MLHFVQSIVQGRNEAPEHSPKPQFSKQYDKRICLLFSSITSMNFGGEILPP